MLRTTWAKLLLFGMLGLLPLLLPQPLNAQTATPPAPGTNLLRNPGFEEGFYKQCCQPTPEYLPNTPIDEVQIAIGWRAWWLAPQEPASGQEPTELNFPATCENTTSLFCRPWHRPEYREAAPFAERIHAGNNAQKYFTFASLHEAGIYQQVSNVRPGDALRFSIYMHAWSTNNPGSLISSGQTSMTMRIGIDPTGGTTPYSSNIVWSPVVDHYDIYARYEVTATAQNSTVTVFTYSRPIFHNLHNDIYVDTAELIVLAQPGGPGGRTTRVPGPTNTPGPSPTPSRTPTPSVTPTPTSTRTPTATPTPTITPSPTGWPTSTPLPNGEIWWVIRTGDTLRVLAFYNNTTVEEIMRLNNMTNSIVSVGQQVLVKVVDTPTPTPTETETPLPTAAFTPTETTVAPLATEPMAADNMGDICVVIYNDTDDDNSQTTRLQLEGLIIAVTQNDVAVNNGLSALAGPTCFSEIPTGEYRIDIAVPDDYTAATAAVEILVNAGQTTTVEFALSPVGDAAAPNLANPGNDNSTLLIGAAGIALALAAVIGMVILIIFRRRA